MNESDKEISYILGKLNHLEYKEIVPALLKKGFNRQKAIDLLEFLEKNNLVELNYSDKIKLIYINEYKEKIKLKDFSIKAKITPKGKTFIKENTSFWNKVLGEWKMYLFFGLPTALILFSLKSGLFFPFNSEDSDSIDFTVFVHGPNGHDDLILRNQGKVYLDLKTDRREASINEKGEATFKQVPSSVTGRAVKINIEHPEPYRPVSLDSLYRISNGAAIYLQVKLYNIGNIYGNVLDSRTNKGVDSVRVSVRDAYTFTDIYGYYKLEIPSNYQKKYQNIRFEKNGYDIVQKNNIPIHTKQSVDVLIKKSNVE
ncbi:hypothetical protein [Costertonia aggregata]|uniref:Uncharacterized protein n=1 Tax=Costertonia aggregata TaxID=343403 RepID=A0A7H9APQ7_9FLAO|nr:hypothetical protein [Costertonia aggregata]QLG45410.1 hypothetical protein HYG79_08640 [Costertonia aggregata]